MLHICEDSGKSRECIKLQFQRKLQFCLAGVLLAVCSVCSVENFPMAKTTLWGPLDPDESPVRAEYVQLQEVGQGGGLQG